MAKITNDLKRIQRISSVITRAMRIAFQMQKYRVYYVI